MTKSLRSKTPKVIDLNPEGLRTEPVTLKQVQQGLFESVFGGMFAPDPDPGGGDARVSPCPDELES